MYPAQEQLRAVLRQPARVACPGAGSEAPRPGGQGLPDEQAVARLEDVDVAGLRREGHHRLEDGQPAALPLLARLVLQRLPLAAVLLRPERCKEGLERLADSVVVDGALEGAAAEGAVVVPVKGAGEAASAEGVAAGRRHRLEDRAVADRALAEVRELRLPGGLPEPRREALHTLQVPARGPLRHGEGPSGLRQRRALAAALHPRRGLDPERLLHVHGAVLVVGRHVLGVLGELLLPYADGATELLKSRICAQVF